MDSLLPPVGTTYASFNRFKLDMFERGRQFPLSTSSFARAHSDYTNDSATLDQRTRQKLNAWSSIADLLQHRRFKREILCFRSRDRARR